MVELSGRDVLQFLRGFGVGFLHEELGDISLCFKDSYQVGLAIGRAINEFSKGATGLVGGFRELFGAFDNVVSVIKTCPLVAEAIKSKFVKIASFKAAILLAAKEIIFNFFKISAEIKRGVDNFRANRHYDSGKNFGTVASIINPY